MPRTRSKPISRDRILSAALVLAHRLCRDALWSERRSTWLGWSRKTLQDRPTLIYAPVDGSLYDGTAGIALFLGAAASITGDAIMRTTAGGALQHAASRLADRSRSSFYSGLPGYAFTASVLAQLWNDDDMHAHARGASFIVAGQTPDPRAWDVISGSAGCIPILLRAHNLFDDGCFLDAAVAHGEHLVARARTFERGVAWTDPDAGHPPFIGMAHGALGSATSLTQLASATGIEHFSDCAQSAIAYCSVAREERERLDPRSATTSWCYGSVGIGLAYVKLQRNAHDAVVEVRDALDVDRNNLCLCHGESGSIELLAEANAADAAVERLVTLIEAGMPLNCGMPDGREAPGLMNGIAGIGYALLRRADPTLPSVLAL